MNGNLFRLVFNKKLGMYVPTHEAARSHGKDSGKAGQAAAALAALLAAFPAMATLPVPCGGGACGVNVNPTAFVSSGAASYAVNGTQGIVTQTSSKAILNWQSFNLGQGYSLEFKQPGADAAALNRIWQADASVIAGALKSNGQVYLINQNGILFANGAQVNVGGLVASALDIDDAVFLHPNGLFSLTDEAGNVSAAFQWTGTAEGFATSLVRVEPDARLEAALGGAVMLFAPRVINQGEIHTQEGQTVLAAGGKVYLAAPPDPKGLVDSSPYKGLAGMLVEVDPFEGQDAQGNDVKISGQVINDAMGRIIAERGNASLAALAVNQMGRVTATTSVTHKGSIRLLARERMTYDQQFANQGAKVIAAQDTGEALLGADSVTEVLPELNSDKTITAGQSFNASTVEVMGRRIVMDEGASIVVPGGYVSLSAQADGSLFEGGDGSDNGRRIYLAKDSLIDVSGVEDVEIEMARNFIEVELRGTELRDNVLNKNGFIRGKKVWVDIRDLPDTALADVSGYVGQVGRGIGEKLSAGGTAILRSEGDIVQRGGAGIDISGGSLSYQSGYGYASQLVSEGETFNIGNAPADRIYDGIIGQYSVTDPKWGVTRTIVLPQSVQFYEGYVHGQNAGTLKLQANALAMEGALIAHTIVGPYQRQKPAADGAAPSLDQLPALGRLVIGDASQAGVSGGDMKTPDVLLSKTYTALPADFGAGSSLPAAAWDSFVLSTEMLARSGVGHVAVYSNGQISVAPGGGLELPAYGSLTLMGEKVVVQDDIRVAGGNITLASQQTVATTDFGDTGVLVGEGVTLSVAGTWTNDTLPDADLSAKVVLDGGNIDIKSFTTLELAEGSLLNADGGAWYNSARKLKGGKGGDISLAAAAYAPVLQGELRAWGMSRGGKLSLKAPALTLGPTARGVAGELLLAPELFAGNGFREYVLEGVDSVVVSDGVQLRPYQTQMVLDQGFAAHASGDALQAFFHAERQPDDRRQAVNLSLKATSGEAYLPDGTRTGWLTVGEGADIELEPGGILDLSAKHHQLLVQGRLATPAGEIRLTMHGDPSQPSDPGYDAAQAIWIANGAELSAGGAVVYRPGDDGLLHGDVLDGGRIALTAHKGYVVAQSGARLDVSGASAQLDVAAPDGEGASFLRQTVAGAGGAIDVQAREGIVLDASLSAAAPGSVGGSLSLTLDRNNALGELKTPAYPGTSSAYGSNDPDRRWKIVVGESFGGLADGLDAGDSIDAAAPGRARIGTQQLAQAGFASLTLNAEHAVAFEGDVVLGMQRDLVLNAPVIETDGGQVNLSAAYVGLGNTATYAQRQKLEIVLAGAGHLGVSAQHIDLNGYLALQGFNGADFLSQGDIRAVGVIPENGTPYPVGKLGASGTLTFTARQIYPATLTDYGIEVQGEGSKVVFKGNGAPAPVLSAAGSLVVQADVIAQEGVIKAPFGQIVLKGHDAVTLSAGSLTSVSGEGQVIPLGSTVLTGRKWVYSVNGLSRELDATDKVVSLAAPAVDVALGATVDVSGTGDLLAQEWIPGLGGSKDVLDAANSPNTYAILPGYDSAFAPHDYQYMDGAAQPLTGQSVYLDGVAGLPAAYYTLLPARYALLPGAYAVTALAGYQDMSANQNHVRADGAGVVAGQSAVRLADGGLVDIGRRGAYLVESDSQVRAHAEYLATKASQFHAGTGKLLPGDAGRVSIEATASLEFEGDLVATHGEGLRGALMDLSAPRLAVVTDGAQGVAGYLNLDVDMLNALGAESLLLGGTRIQTSAGTWVRVGADDVLLANDAQHALKGPEILLAARDMVTLAEGAALNSTGSTGTHARRLTVGHVAHADLDLNRDGLLNDADGIALDKDLNYDGQMNLDDVAISALGSGYDYSNADGSKRQANRGDLAPAFAIGDLNGDRRVDLADLDAVDGDGALVAVAAVSGLEIKRQAVDSDRGTLNAAADAAVSGHAVIMDATRDNLSKASPVISTGGQLTIGAGRIGFGAVPADVPGLRLGETALKNLLASVSDLALRSYSTLDMHGDVDMGRMYAELREENPALAMPRLRLEAAGIAGYGGDAVLQAGILELNNLSGTAFTTPVLANGDTLTPAAGTLTLKADVLKLGEGVFRIAGYGQASVDASHDLLAQGEGSLGADGSLTLRAPRIAAADGADYSFTTGDTLKTLHTTLPAGQTQAAAGIVARLSFIGDNVEHGGVIETPVGEVSFLARNGDVKLVDGGVILARGRIVAIHDESVALPAGSVRLESETGNVVMEAGSRIDVSATGTDAGEVVVLAKQGNFRAEGQLLGAADALLGADGGVAAKAGEGAAFRLDAKTLFDAGQVGGGDDFSAVNAALGAGFRGERIFRLRSGDISVAAADKVQARRIELSADAGAIDVFGTLDASGDKGGEIGLYANGDLVLHNGGKVLAVGQADTESTAGTLGRGGTVILSSAAGDLNTQTGSTIDVSGDQAGTVWGAGGRVWLRAQRTGTGAGSDLAISALDGEIAGAREILAEAVKVYSGYSRINKGNTSGTTLGFNSLNTDNNTFQAKTAAIASRLFPNGNGVFRVAPGVEVRNAGNIEVAADWNLFWSTSSSGLFATRSNAPMVLTLRAGADLDIKGSINDGFWAGKMTGLASESMGLLSNHVLKTGYSSSYNLIAGADTDSANPFDVAVGSGNLTLAKGKFIRTGTGDIRIATGGNMALAGDGSVIYTAGAEEGSLPPELAGFTKPTTSLKPSYPTNGGDVFVRVMGDIDVQQPSQIGVNEWLYRYGQKKGNDWYSNPQATWWTRYDKFQQGLGALGGGDVSVVAGGDVSNLRLFAPTNGRLGGDRTLPVDETSLWVQGGGDVNLQAGGDVTGGLIYVAQGKAALKADGAVDVGLAIGDTQAQVQALDGIRVRDVTDPMIADSASGLKLYFYGMTPESGLDVLSVRDSVKLSSSGGAYPAHLRVHAPLGDIATDSAITLFPGADGQLVLAAGGSVGIDKLLVMSDYPLEKLTDVFNPSLNSTSSLSSLSGYQDFQSHDPGLLHLDDFKPARIYAQAGDVWGSSNSAYLVLPKPAVVMAGQDVKDLSMVIQNLRPDDFSRVVAGRDVRLPDGYNIQTGDVSASQASIAIAGPGYMMVTAGRDVDLGSSGGLISLGNEYNPYLDRQGADLMVLAGLGSKDGALRQPDYQAFAAKHLVVGSEALEDLQAEFGYRARKDIAVRVLAEHPELDPDNADDKETIQAYLDGAYADQVLARKAVLRDAFEAMPLEARVTRVFFNELQEGGKDFNEALSPKTAQDAKRGYDAVALLFPGKDADGPITYAGNVNFYFSQVRSNRGGDVEIFAPGGLVNVGLASSGKLTKSESELGLFTIRGGDIRAYVHDDFLVNQSRVFTLGGGDILLWSDIGDIDAGKGAKTAAAAPPPQLRVENGRIFFDISSSVAGSGIGTINTSRANSRDDGYLIAPNGEINAGDAGIRSAGNLSIAAVRVVGADNIQVGGISTGVPVSDTSGLSSGLSGVSGLSEAANATSEATKSLGSSAKDNEAGAQAAKQLMAGFKPSFISVEVLGFGAGTASVNDGPDEAEKTRREEDKRLRGAQEGA